MKHTTAFIVVIALMLFASSNAFDLIFDYFYQPTKMAEPSEQIKTMSPEVDAPIETTISRSAAEIQPEEWTITAYCACEICCPGSADNLTANMSTPLEGVTIAADPSVPFGTRIWIEGLGERTVMDRGSSIIGNHIDVFFSDHQTAKAFGVQELKVRIFN